MAGYVATYRWTSSCLRVAVSCIAPLPCSSLPCSASSFFDSAALGAHVHTHALHPVSYLRCRAASAASSSLLRSAAPSSCPGPSLAWAAAIAPAWLRIVFSAAPSTTRPSAAYCASSSCSMLARRASISSLESELTLLTPGRGLGSSAASRAVLCIPCFVGVCGQLRVDTVV